MPTQSGFYQGGIVIGDLRPAAQVMQWNVGKVSPVGFRNFESGVFRPAAKRGLVGGFQAQHASGNPLQFGDVIVQNENFFSPTVAMTLNLGVINDHPNSLFFNAEGVDDVFKIFNMRLWVGSLTAFDQAETPIFHFLTSNSWQRKLVLRPQTPGAQILPSGFPTTQNIFAKNPQVVFVSGNNKDLEHTHFIYMVAEFPSGNYPLGTYGGLGQGDFTFKLSYDWTNIFSNVLQTDLIDCPLAPIPLVGVSGASIPKGLISFWNLDHNSPRVDSAGNTHLQTVNTVLKASGVSFHTNAADSFQSVGYLTSSGISENTNLNFGDQDFSLITWVQPSSLSSDMPLFSKWNEVGNQRQWMISYDNTLDRFRFDVSNDGTSEVGIAANIFGSPVLSGWHMIYAFHDAANDQIGISINDGPVDSRVHSSGIFQSTADVNIGSAFTPGLTIFDGASDATGAWNRQLTQKERGFMYNATSGNQFPFGLQGELAEKQHLFWRLNEGTGFPRIDIIKSVQMDQFNGPEKTLGLIGSGVQFVRASGQYLQSSGSLATQLGDRDFTIAGFFFIQKPALIGFQPIISKWNETDNNREYLLYFDSRDAKLKFSATDNGLSSNVSTVSHSGIAQSGFWHMFAVRHNTFTNTLELRMDNDIDTSVSFSNGVFAGNAALEFGGISQSGLFWDGKLDSISYWNKYLSNTELEVFRNDNGL